jgi:oligosaccharide amylase
MGTKPFLIDAVIGNSRMLATLTENGQIQRLWWPHIDYPQHIEALKLGIAEKCMPTRWLEDDGWQRTVSYLGDSNVVQTEVQNKCMKVVLTDWCVPGADLLVRQVRCQNTASQAKDLQLVLFSHLNIAESPRYNTTYFDYEKDCLLQYRHSYAFAWGSDRVVTGFTAGKALAEASQGKLSGIATDMHGDGAMTIGLGIIPPGEEVTAHLFLAAGLGRHQALGQLEEAKAQGGEALLSATLDYWQKYLQQGVGLETGNTKLDSLYRRSLLVFALMHDEKSGGLSAAPDLDEDRLNCGGYAYCWGRDAAYITNAIDQAGYHQLVSAFYRWAMGVQEPDGSWDQRYFMDGHMAPAWGLQIDQCGSLLWGLWQHYQHTGNISILQELWPSVEKGMDFILGYMDSRTGLPKPSNDLWEERWGSHSYSAVAVWAGVLAAAEIAATLGHQASVWHEAATGLKERIETQLWSPEHNRFLRGIEVNPRPGELAQLQAQGEEIRWDSCPKGYPRPVQPQDSMVDVSLLGLCYPFGFISAQDLRMEATAKAIEEQLWVPGVGGIKRYENDWYIGGNPWILTTLWLAIYHQQRGNRERAQELLIWALEHATPLGLLPEQVDRQSGKPAWVVPLTWSHAMLVLAVLMLYKDQDTAP